ncbi:galanin receptor type 1-like [Hydractinia symbiolongicarpus]|uniref:galanin receptor type 1-like n=1 Tax=Hydractinia symbiolongicarpus TaxID=13093 RepID=UPI00254AFAE5|nr:galanin receptor type 1-like [Hydractinia symbiolongicarpus]XP_057313845.1 galanin receptor type 1-like [Hydractinia symbiolongicarpus]XP_057313846.1 galanin receptor type 1-like [Hydractinia symbiolongicarpus]
MEQFTIISIILLVANANMASSTVDSKVDIKNRQAKCLFPGKKSFSASQSGKKEIYFGDVKTVFTSDVKRKLKTYCSKCGFNKVECNCTYLLSICNFIKMKRRKNFTFNCIRWENLTKASFNVFFGICGLVGNFIVLAVTCFALRKVSRCQYMITCLAGVDFAFSILQIIINVPHFWTCSWLYGEYMCKFFYGASDLSFVLALGFILLIAIERFTGVVWNVKKCRKRRILFIGIGVNITLALIITLTLSLKTSLFSEDLGEKKICRVTWSDYSLRVYHWTVFVACFLIPICAVGVLYYCVIKKLRSETKKAFTAILDNRQRIKRLRKNKRIMKTLICLIIALVILVLPNRVVSILFSYTHFKSVTVYAILVIIKYVPYSLHVAINPILYSIIDVNFQDDMKHLLKCTLRRNNSSHLSDHSGANHRYVNTQRVHCQTPSRERIELHGRIVH